jgi:hypothetical protein
VQVQLVHEALFERLADDQSEGWSSRVVGPASIR